MDILSVLKERKNKIAVGASLILTSYISACVTNVVVRKKLEEEYNTRLDSEVASGMKFLLAKVADEGIPLKSVELTDDEEQIEKDIAAAQENGPIEFKANINVPKPPLEDMRARNQQVEYDKITTREGYVEETTAEESIAEDIFVISRDEYLENLTGYEQMQVSSFADGGVLDIDAEPLEESADKLGTNLPFGHLSEDPRIVYIRNNRLRLEFEVVQDDQNAQDFLQHSMHQLADKFNNPR